ncbi:MAG: phospholipase D-like domain-containing protein [Chloroflexota bacterium]|nr:phospholipase D-like domain-containing protein [Chloroflexota bacterium]
MYAADQRMAVRDYLARGVTRAKRVCRALLQRACPRLAWHTPSRQVGNFPRTPPLTAKVGEVQVDIYTYGEDLYDAMFQAIEQADQQIWFENFIWKGDHIGQRFKQALERAAQRGLDVYAVFDGFANLVVPRQFKRFPPTIHTLQFRIVPKPWQLLNPRHYGRDHRKILLVDGNVGFVGGYNIGARYATTWRDTHVCVRGPIIWQLEQVCSEFWAMHGGERVPHLAAGGAGVWESRIRVHRNAPTMLAFPIRDMYLAAIDRAQHHMYLTFGYFIPDRDVLRALLAAAARGVDVRVLMPERSNHRLADWAARGFYRTMLVGGITVLLYQHAMLHAKTATIDGHWSTIGTANIDRLSLVGNYEVNLEFYDAELAQQMERIFATDSSNARELTLDEWRQHPWKIRFSEALLRPLRPLL